MQRKIHTPILRLLAFYISARYPDYKEKLTSILSREEAQEIIIEAKEAFKWIQSLKKYSI
ncbi:MAG: HEPN domain-containing protein [Bacteroidales bacterium]|nr:HEPN domain-containing protein [Bacteroidales bacterium]